MKKLCIALCLLCLNSAYALPVGNPAEASLFYGQDSYCDPCGDPCAPCDFHIGWGYYGDYVFNRHMETVNGKDIDTTQVFTNALYLVVNFCEQVDFFTCFGASRLSLNTSLGAFNSADPHPLFEIESGSAFSFNVGGRITLLHWRCFSLGVMGQYFMTEPDIKRMYIAAGAVSYPDEELKTRYSEWQIAGGISYHYNDFFIPYVAIKYAHSFWKLDDGNLVIIESNTGTHLFNLRNQRNWGYAVGLTFSPPTYEKMAVTVEARFGAEKALSVNGQMRF